MILYISFNISQRIAQKEYIDFSCDLVVCEWQATSA